MSKAKRPRRKFTDEFKEKIDQHQKMVRSERKIT